MRTSDAAEHRFATDRRDRGDCGACTMLRVFPVYQLRLIPRLQLKACRWAAMPHNPPVCFGKPRPDRVWY